jgi:hypothetical protein
MNDWNANDGHGNMKNMKRTSGNSGDSGVMTGSGSTRRYRDSPRVLKKRWRWRLCASLQKWDLLAMRLAGMSIIQAAVETTQPRLAPTGLAPIVIIRRKSAHFTSIAMLQI